MEGAVLKLDLQIHTHTHTDARMDTRTHACTHSEPTNAEDIPKGGQACLKVELGGLCEVGFFSKVVQLEQRGPSLHLCLHHCRGCDLDKRNTLLLAAHFRRLTIACAHLKVSSAEVVLSEALRDGRPKLEHL